MNPLHELRRALITAWLHHRSEAAQPVEYDRRGLEPLILMWLRTPHSTTLLWTDYRGGL